MPDFLQRHSVDYLFYGARERALGNLPWLAEYTPVFSSGDVDIYEVRND